MTWTLKQRFPFVTGDDENRTLRYQLQGDDIENDTDQSAEAYLLANSPATWPTTGNGKRYYRDKLSALDERGHFESNGNDIVIYDADLEYIELEAQLPDENYPQASETTEIRYDFGLQNLRIRYALKNVEQYMLTGVAKPNPAQLGIAVDLEGKAQGVDIQEPSEQFEVIYTPLHAVVTPAYLKTVGDLIGTVNKEDFAHREAGEVLFAGFSGSERNQEDYRLAYRFVVRKNIENATISGVDNIDKKGWEFLDPLVKQTKVNSASGQNVQTSLQGFQVMQVYEEQSFKTLNLPGIPGAQPDP